MDFTQHDYEERKSREGSGRFTDEDARLVALYEDNGYRVASGGPLNDPHSPKIVDPGASKAQVSPSHPGAPGGQAGGEGSAGGNDEASTDDTATESASRYSGLSKSDLHAEAKRRGLPVGGGQAAVVARLEQADVEAAGKTEDGADTSE